MSENQIQKKLQKHLLTWCVSSCLPAPVKDSIDSCFDQLTTKQCRTYISGHENDVWNHSSAEKDYIPLVSRVFNPSPSQSLQCTISSKVDLVITWWAGSIWSSFVIASMWAVPPRRRNTCLLFSWPKINGSTQLYTQGQPGKCSSVKAAILFHSTQ